ncbi:WxcM-like domain-containing protein [Pseudomonadota bacterium]
MTSKSFIHKTAICETNNIGKNTRIWAFVHILPRAVIGNNCNICDHVFIENDVVIGDNSTIKSGVQLWDGVTIKDNVFVGPNASFTNDKYPKSKQYSKVGLRTTIQTGATIGANATILPGLTVGQCSMVGAGAVVTRSVPDFAVVTGNPAKIIDYVGETGTEKIDHLRVSDTQLSKIVDDITSLPVKGCTIHRLRSYRDLRGSLSAIEFKDELPFIPQRSFLVYGVSNNKIRGTHAHKQCHQFLIAISGSLSVVLDDGHKRCQVELDVPSMGLYVPCKVWGVQYLFSSDAKLLVFASLPYQADDYIRTYAEYLQYIENEK